MRRKVNQGDSSPDRTRKKRTGDLKPEKSPIKERTAKKKALSREIVQELNALRGVAEETIGRCQLRLAARINDLIRLYEEQEIAGEKRPVPPAKVELQVLKQLRAVKVKPLKGRIKDVVRLHLLIRQMTDFHEEFVERTLKQKGEQ